MSIRTVALVAAAVAAGFVLVMGGLSLLSRGRRAAAPSRAELAASLAAGGGSNVAVTVRGSADLRLRPRRLEAGAAEALDRVRAAAAGLPRWTVVSAGDGVVIAERRTALFRFVDDVQVLLTPDGSGTLVEARSASRVGHSDLGQCSRNLAELLDALGGEPQ